MINCFSFAPKNSIPALVSKICNYLSEHPGWSREELEDQIKQYIGQIGVESFNGRSGAVVLSKEDVNNLKITSAYFADDDESIDELDLLALYNQGVRFVFTNYNSVTSGYDLAFALDYFSDYSDVVYYPMATGSGGGNIISVNGKTGIVELSLSDILGDSGAQVKLCTATEFTSNTKDTWNAYYENGFRIVGVVNSSATAIDYIYLLKQDEDNHLPIGLSTGASDAYTPSNPPPYPVTSVNGKTGVVTGLYDSQNPPPYPVTSVNGKTGVVTGLYDAENQPPYPVTSVNGKTGVVTGLYDTANPPPYPVTSVNGKTGAVTGLYDAENPPPYPVTSVLGRSGSVQSDYYVLDISETTEVNQNIPFLPFDIIRAGDVISNLPAGETTIEYIIFNETVPTYSARFVVISNKAGLSIAVTDTARSGDKFALKLEFKNVTSESINLGYCFSIINLSNIAYTVNTFRRYL